MPGGKPVDTADLNCTKKVQSKNAQHLKVLIQFLKQASETGIIQDALFIKLVDYSCSQQRKARFCLKLNGITEKIETGSAAGKLVFHVFAALAEFERNLIRERTKAGLEAARARGRKGGRKPALTEKAVKEIRQLLKDPDINVTEIAKRYGVSRASIYKYLK